MDVPCSIQGNIHAFSLIINVSRNLGTYHKCLASFLHNYREYRIRTYDPLVPNQVLYQAELIPVRKNAPNRSRTCNRLIRSQVLYPIELWVHCIFS